MKVPKIDIVNGDELFIIVAIRNTGGSNLLIDGKVSPPYCVTMLKLEYGEMIVVKKENGDPIDPEKDVEISQAYEDDNFVGKSTIN